jgi:hypothetical protein
MELDDMLVVLLVVVVKGNKGEFIGEVGLQFGEPHFGQIGCQVLNGSLLGSPSRESSCLPWECMISLEASWRQLPIGVSFQVLDFVVVNVSVV